MPRSRETIVLMDRFLVVLARDIASDANKISLSHSSFLSSLGDVMPSHTRRISSRFFRSRLSTSWSDSQAYLCERAGNYAREARTRGALSEIGRVPNLFSKPNEHRVFYNALFDGLFAARIPLQQNPFTVAVLPSSSPLSSPPPPSERC